MAKQMCADAEGGEWHCAACHTPRMLATAQSQKQQRSISSAVFRSAHLASIQISPQGNKCPVSEVWSCETKWFYFFFTPTLCYLPQQPQEAAFVALLQNSVLNNLGPILDLFFCFHYNSYSSHNCLSKVYLSQREGHLSLTFYFICLENLHNHLSRSATNICNKNLFYELQQLLKLTYQIVDIQLLKHVHISRNLHLISYFIILIESACFLRYLDILTEGIPVFSVF